jgi:hypothetical protein
MTPGELEPFTTTSMDVPEHLQFVQMMYDVQAQAQRCREMPQDSRDEEGLINQIAKLSIATSVEGSIAATDRTRLSLSPVQNVFYKLGPGIHCFRSNASSERKTAAVDDTSAVTPRSLQIIDRACRSDQTVTRPVFTNAAAVIQAVMDRPARSPPRSTHILTGAKELWQAAKEEDKEEQETVVFQIEDTLEEDRPWLAYLSFCTGLLDLQTQHRVRTGNQ